MTKTSQNKKNILQCLFLLIFSISLFILANPNFVYNKGFGFLAWIYYIPLLFLIQKCSFKTVWLAGAVFGFAFYAGYAYWLINYGIICFIFICSFYAIIYSLLFLILKYTESRSISYNWILIWLILISFEYIKTKGFLGFNYGVTGYTQWRYTSLIQICDIIGIFGLNTIIVFFSCLCFSFINKILKKKRYKTEQENNLELNQFNTHLHYLNENQKILKKFSIMPQIIIALFFLIGFIFINFYGLVKNNFGTKGEITVAAIQHNDNPEEHGLDNDIKNFKTLYELTDSALEIDDNIQLVVWPETAISSSLQYKLFRQNNGSMPDEKEDKSINFALNVINYINRKNLGFVIGNNGIELNNNYNPESDMPINELLIYSNDALYFPSDKNNQQFGPEIYKKIKLVPFTEGFPYKKIFPALYDKILNQFGYLYTPGIDYKVFKINDLYFSTPICFEDTFPETGRNMYKKGARCFINLTNDSWSKSSSCQYQHLAMAIFRSVENRVPSVRSTASGITCLISERGEIVKRAEEFCPSFIIGKINVIDKNREPTFYCRNGHLIEYTSIVFAGLFLLIQIFTDIIIKIKGKHNGKKR